MIWRRPVLKIMRGITTFDGIERQDSRRPSRLCIKSQAALKPVCRVFKSALGDCLQMIHWPLGFSDPQHWISSDNLHRIRRCAGAALHEHQCMDTKARSGDDHLSFPALLSVQLKVLV